MPNHTTTILEVCGNAESVKAFVAAIKTGRQIKVNDYCDELIDEYDFDVLLPMPEELKGVGCPVRIVSETAYKAAVAKLAQGADKAFGLPITQAMSDDYIARFGCDNWYDWRHKNFGTKWGMYSVNFAGFSSDGEKATFSYDTAWSPASQYFLRISPKFPELTFCHFFADEGGGFLGWEKFCNGECVEEQDLEWDSDEGIELRERLGVYYPEDEEVEVEA